MIVSIGTDLVSVRRIEGVWQRYGDRFVRRILTPQERSALPGKAAAHYLARRFSAKEAVAKALGTGMAAGTGWQQLEILHAKGGRPLVKVLGAAKARLQYLGADEVHLSISDEKDYALAFAVISRRS